MSSNRSADLPMLGPLLFATIRCNAADQVAAAYCRHLHLKIKSKGRLSSELADLMAAPELANTPCYWLGPKAGHAWLRILELPTDEPVVPLKRRGWMALEVSVSNVDELATQLAESPFTVIGEPADLAFSSSIRAMQVTGLAGEVLYLTEIKEEIAEFQLKPADAFVDRLFIAVLAAGDRGTSGDFYASLGTGKPLMTNTRIGVLNRAWEHKKDHEYPIAIASMAGSSLIEVDHLPEACKISDDEKPPAGIASMGMTVDKIGAMGFNWQSPPKSVNEFPWSGCLGACVRGPDGEWIELVEKAV